MLHLPKFSLFLKNDFIKHCVKIYFVNLLPNTGKYRPEKKTVLNTFHSVNQVYNERCLCSHASTGFKQKQSLAYVLQNRRSSKFRNTHKKKPVLETLSNKVTGLTTCNFIKKSTNTHVSCEYCKILKNIFFTKHLRVNVNECNKKLLSLSCKIMKICQTHFKNLALSTLPDFYSMVDYFPSLFMKGLRSTDFRRVQVSPLKMST